jgi:DNA-binding NarL/FixJ family response regulator
MKTLTQQEYRIAKLLEKGHKREPIQRQLGITESTFRVHLSNICKKLEMTSPNALQIRERLRGYKHEKTPPMKTHRTLTPAEREVIGMRIMGKTFWQIAEARGTALSTALNISSIACHKLRIRKSTNPNTLSKALAIFDAQALPPSSLPVEVSTNPNDY